jgi:hypothetical protein
VPPPGEFPPSGEAHTACDHTHAIDGCLTPDAVR